MMEMQGKGKTPIEIHDWLKKTRKLKRVKPTNLTNIRKMLKGKTFKRAVPETRGAKRVLSRKQVLKLDAVRQKLLKKADSETKVTYEDILRAGRLAMKVAPNTLAQNFLDEGIDVKWRPARDAADLREEDKAERKETCGRWRYLPNNYFTHQVDAILDNKKFRVPTTHKALRHVRRSRCRGHLRTRAEGKASHCRKPNTRKNRVNTGGGINVCAGIINGKLHLWHHLKGGKWNGGVAADLYRGPLLKALKKHRGEKATYLVAEDNDPSGYKSKKGLAAKEEVGIKTMSWPRYSPDLNPLDFHVWHEVEERVLNKLKGPVSTKKFGELLRRTAKALNQEQILKAVLGIKGRAKAIYDADGGLIERD